MSPVVYYTRRMEYREVGLSGIRVSELALGTMNFGSGWHGTGAVGERKAREMLALAADSGVNLIDTADIYGRGAAEKLLGKLLRSTRDAPGPAPDHLHAGSSPAGGYPRPP